MKGKTSFLIHYDNSAIIEKLSDEDAGKLFKALFKYAAEGIEPNFENQVISICFDFIRLSIDRDAEKYAERCEKNRENGRKGGLAKASNSKQMLPNASDTKQGLANLADKDKDKDKDRDKDRDKDNIYIYKEGEKNTSRRSEGIKYPIISRSGASIPNYEGTEEPGPFG